jgi:hypothetical protein
MEKIIAALVKEGEERDEVRIEQELDNFMSSPPPQTTIKPPRE